jgi:hypothetical protein
VVPAAIDERMSLARRSCARQTSGSVCSSGKRGAAEGLGFSRRRTQPGRLPRTIYPLVVTLAATLIAVAVARQVRSPRANRIDDVLPRPLPRSMSRPPVYASGDAHAEDPELGASLGSRRERVWGETHS